MRSQCESSKASAENQEQALAEALQVSGLIQSCKNGNVRTKATRILLRWQKMVSYDGEDGRRPGRKTHDPLWAESKRFVKKLQTERTSSFKRWKSIGQPVGHMTPESEEPFAHRGRSPRSGRGF